MRDACRETKVDKLDSLLRLIEKNVFKLDVSVCYITLMTVMDGLDDLAPQELRFELRHLPIRLHLEIAVEATAIDILHNEEDLLVRFKYFEQLCYMIMI